jgi:hypothetical protein
MTEEKQTSLNELLAAYRDAHDAMTDAAAPTWGEYMSIQADIQEAKAPFEARTWELTQLLHEIEDPFKRRLESLAKEIIPLVIEVLAESTTAQGVKVKYRKGYTRFSYDNDVMQAVMLTLQDTHPGTVEAIKRAIKKTVVEPKVTLDRVKE